MRSSIPDDDTLADHGEAVPRGKLRRSMITGATAAGVGGRMLGFAARKPFLSPRAKGAARERLDETNAKAIFRCLSVLRGTALKIAQLLSMELELFPEAIRRELEKSYNQVPPMNRALVRKAARVALGEPLENLFDGFDTRAFAAASLGQVHAARSPRGMELAVKVQYPGIHRSIEDDMQLVRNMLRPLPDYSLLAPVLEEIGSRLREETDYLEEAASMEFFGEHLDIDGVTVPKPWRNGTRQRILAAERVAGLPLNQWLETGPDQETRDRVGQRLNAIFLESFYGLHRIHADPNPGNFVIAPDGTVGLVDFGCVKSFSPEFVTLYGRLPSIVVRGRKEEYFEALRQVKLVADELDPATEEAIFETAYGFGRWLGQLFETEYFDFGAHPEFMSEGQRISQQMFKYRKHFTMNPEFVFLDRTRYGLLRIYERLGCRIRLRNAYEFGDAAMQTEEKRS